MQSRLCCRIGAAVVVAIGASTAAAATSNDARAGEKPPAAVLQYVEAVPTSEGKHPTGFVGVNRRKNLTTREQEAVATQRPGVAKALSEVARSTAFGAPQSTLDSERETPATLNAAKTTSGGAPSADASSLSATSTIDGSSSSTLLVLIIALAAGTALAAAYALLRRRSARP